MTHDCEPHTNVEGGVQNMAPAGKLTRDGGRALTLDLHYSVPLCCGLRHLKFEPLFAEHGASWQPAARCGGAGRAQQAQQRWVNRRCWRVQARRQQPATAAAALPVDPPAQGVSHPRGAVAKAPVAASRAWHPHAERCYFGCGRAGATDIASTV